jgi:hypothetical protein
MAELQPLRECAMSDRNPAPDELPPGNDRLRVGIAILGAALPPILLGFGLWFASHPGGSFPPTLSDFYFHPPASTFFIGILWANGVFLVLYQGYATVPPAYCRALPGPLARWMTDAVLSSLAGFAMILTAVVPTCEGNGCGLASFATLHFLAAFVCLGTLGLIAGFTFTASDKAPAAQSAFRRQSNRIYRICAALIWGALAAIGVLKVVGPGNPGAAVFWLEAVAIWAFAYSWWRKSRPDPEEAAGSGAERAAGV